MSPGILQAPSGNCDRFAPPAQQSSNEFLRHCQFIAGGTVPSQQQPATESLFESVSTVAGGGEAICVIRVPVYLSKIR